MEDIADPIAGIRKRLLLQQEEKRDTFSYDGLEFFVQDGVFPPTHFLSTTVFTDNLKYPVGGSFWEVGCGVGVTAVVAAMQGCKKVLASDISPEAVENALVNIKKHNVEHIVSARAGDLFDVLEENEKFDVIYWNSNFIYAPEDFEFESEYHRAFADPGYNAHRRFFKNVNDYLNDDGKIYLGFSGQGDHSQLDLLLKENNFSFRIVLTEIPDPKSGIQYQILELDKL